MGVIVATRGRGLPGQQSHLNVISITFLVLPNYAAPNQPSGLTSASLESSPHRSLGRVANSELKIESGFSETFTKEEIHQIGGASTQDYPVAIR